MPCRAAAEGVSIELTDAFKKEEKPGYTILYTDDVKVTVQATSGEVLGDMSLDAYSKMICDSMDLLSGSGPEAADGVPVVEYTLPETSESEETAGLMAFFKAGTQYWNISFSCKPEDYSARRPQFVAWAQTVELP